MVRLGKWSLTAEDSQLFADRCNQEEFMSLCESDPRLVFLPFLTNLTDENMSIQVQGIVKLLLNSANEAGI